MKLFKRKFPNKKRFKINYLIFKISQNAFYCITPILLRGLSCFVFNLENKLFENLKYFGVECMSEISFESIQEVNIWECLIMVKIFDVYEIMFILTIYSNFR